MILNSPGGAESVSAPATGDVAHRYQTVVDAAPALIWMSGLDKRCVYFNRGWLDFTGRTLAQELGDGWLEGVHPDDRGMGFQAFAEVFDARRPVKVEYRLRRHDGVYRWMLDQCAPHYDERGEFAGYVGSVVDIDERHEAEMRLRFFERLVEQATDMAICVDESGRCLYANPSFLKTFGYGSAEEIESQYLDAECTPERQRAHWAGLRQAPIREALWKLRRADGRTLDVIVSAHLIEIDGQPAISCILRDLTERQRLEGELRASNERFQLATEGANDGIWDWDVLTGSDYFSPRWCALLGYGPGQLEATYETWVGLLHPDDRGWVLQSVRDHLEERVPYHVECRMRTREGNYRWYKCRGQAVWDGDGRPLRMAGSIQDVTERVLGQRRINSLNAQLDRNNQELQQQHAKLAALTARLITVEEEERRRVAREIHDDLSQKLAFLQVEIAMLAGQAADAELARRLEACEHLMEEVSNDVRSVAHRLHSAVLDQLGLTPALKALCRETSVREGLEVVFRCKNLELTAEPAVGHCLYRVAQEAVRNVARHAGATAAVVSLKATAGGLRLRVLDRGRGFDLAQTEPMRSLGLTSMEERVRLAGGSFRLVSRLGRGTMVQATVPVG